MSGEDHSWFKRSTNKKRPVTRDNDDEDDDDDDNNKLKLEPCYYYKRCLKSKQIQATYCLHKIDVQF